MRRPLPIAIVAVLTISAAACGGDAGKKEDGKVAKAEPEEKKEPEGKEAWKLDVGKAVEAEADAGAAEEGKVEADAGAAEAANAEAEAGAAEAGAEQAEAGAAEAEAGAAEGEAAEADTPDPAALMTEAKSKKTKDDRAMAALAEAEAAGAKPKDLAKAAKARGDALHETPDRAKTFYEWANEKDPKYPDAAFALAKQAVNLGELEETKKWLRIVHERKGKKLLQQLAFDPMWEIVKDDPEVKDWYDG